MLSNDSKYLAWCGYAFENICLLHIAQVLKKLGISGTFTQVYSWYHKGNDEIPGAQIDILIDRKDGVINLCEAKCSKKSVVTTLITTYAPIQNTYYLDEIYSEVLMEDLFVDEVP